MSRNIRTSRVSDVVIAAIEDTGYANMLRVEDTDESEARLENLEELVNAAVDYDKQQENGLRDFIDHAASNVGHGQVRPQCRRDTDDGALGKGLGISDRLSRRSRRWNFSALAKHKRPERT